MYDQGQSGVAGVRTGAGKAWMLAVALLVIVAVLQQLGQAAASGGTGAGGQGGGQAGVQGGGIEPPAGIQAVATRAMVRMAHALGVKEAGPQMQAQVDQLAVDEVWTVRAAVVAGDLVGPEAATERLKKVRVEPASELWADVSALERLYATPAGGGLSADEAEGLVRRHGWFGELARVYGLPESDAARQTVVGGGAALISVLVGFGVVFVVSFVSGFVLLVVGAISAATGAIKPRMERVPVEGERVLVETLCVFVGAFLVLKLVSAGLALVAGEDVATAGALVMQWLLVLTPAWGVVRGVRWGELRRWLGFHTGRGLVREIGCGVIGYLACVPLFVLGAAVTLLLVLVMNVVARMMTPAGGMPPEPVAPENPIVDLLTSGLSVWQVVLFVLLATVWAPVVEELVFRGATYGALRRRVMWVLSALLTGVMFAMMHGYAVVALPPVLALGVGFAMLREWRGSLVAPMVAHFIHNGALVALMLTVLNLVG